MARRHQGEALRKLLIRANRFGREVGKRRDPSPELSRLRSGDIGLEEYLDARINGCMEHFVGVLEAQDFAYVRAALQEYTGGQLILSGVFATIDSFLRPELAFSTIDERPSIMKHKASTAKKSDEAQGSEDLRQLGRGEITADEYLERRLELQIQKLGGHITENQKDALREIIRTHFMDDPAIVELMERAKNASQRQ